MTTIVTRAGKGSPLTNNEMDTNLTNLNTYKVEQTATTGSAALPAGTTAQRDGSPAVGYTRFNTSLNKNETWSGTGWVAGGGATGAGGDDVFYENGVTVTTSYTLSTNKNAMSVGPITVNSGATVTIPSGQRWIVL